MQELPWPRRASEFSPRSMSRRHSRRSWTSIARPTSSSGPAIRRRHTRLSTAAPEVGVLLPCNVTVSVEEGQTVVRAMNPGVALGVLQAEGLAEVAEDVGEALRRAVQAVASTV